jgi:hypothetical protein
VEHGDYNGTELFGVGTGKRIPERERKRWLRERWLRERWLRERRRGLTDVRPRCSIDRFIWMAYKPNGTDRVRMISHNFLRDGLIDFQLNQVLLVARTDLAPRCSRDKFTEHHTCRRWFVAQLPPPKTKSIEHSWTRFPFGVNYILNKNGYSLSQGFDAVGLPLRICR